VVILDECDPATFNAAFGPDTCHNVVSGGGVALPDFLAALPTGHPAFGKGMVNGAPTAYLCSRADCSAPITSAVTLSQVLTLPPRAPVGSA